MLFIKENYKTFILIVIVFMIILLLPILINIIFNLGVYVGSEARKIGEFL